MQAKVNVNFIDKTDPKYYYGSYQSPYLRINLFRGDLHDDRSEYDYSKAVRYVARSLDKENFDHGICESNKNIVVMRDLKNDLSKFEVLIEIVFPSQDGDELVLNPEFEENQVIVKLDNDEKMHDIELVLSDNVKIGIFRTKHIGYRYELKWD